MRNAVTAKPSRHRVDTRNAKLRCPICVCTLGTCMDPVFCRLQPKTTSGHFPTRHAESRNVKPRIHDATRCTTGCTTGCTTRKMLVYTIQPVVQPVVQPAASCIRSLKLQKLKRKWSLNKEGRINAKCTLAFVARIYSFIYLKSTTEGPV